MSNASGTKAIASKPQGRTSRWVCCLTCVTWIVISPSAAATSANEDALSRNSSGHCSSKVLNPKKTNRAVVAHVAATAITQIARTSDGSCFLVHRCQMDVPLATNIMGVAEQIAAGKNLDASREPSAMRNISFVSSAESPSPGKRTNNDTTER